MPSPGRTSLLAPVAAALALAAWFFVARAACDVGFLADDYDVGATLAARAEREPNPFLRSLKTFGERIGERFEVYRPLTILSIELDYALHGPNGRAHHATNVALWILAALAAARVAAAWARRGDGLEEDRRRRAALRAGSAAFVFALTSFAAIESLGWLVAREDLIVAAAGMAALGAQLARPHSAFAAAPWLLLAFLGKETAVVLPPCLFLARLLDLSSGGDRVAAAKEGAGTPDDSSAPPRRRLLGVFAAPWIVAAAYFGARYALYGGLGTKYLDRSYLEWVADGGAPGRLLQSLGRLFAPWNDALSLRHGLSPLLRFVGPTLAATLLYAGFRFRARRRGDLAALLAAAPFLVASPALTAPMYAVAPSLQQGRTVALPATLLAALLGLAFARARAVGGVLRPGAVVVAALFAAWSGVAQWFHLSPFVAATRHAESFLDDLAATPEGATAVVLGVDDPADPRPGSLRAELVLSDGAYVLSGGISAALGPPFRTRTIPYSLHAAATFDPATGALLAVDATKTAIFVATPPRDLPCGPGEPRLKPWSLPSDAKEAALVEIDVATGAARLLPTNAAAGARVVLSIATDVGRAASFDLGAPPPEGAPRRSASLDSAAAAELFSGGPRFSLWRADLVDGEGAVVASQRARATALPPR